MTNNILDDSLPRALVHANGSKSHALQTLHTCKQPPDWTVTVSFLSSSQLMFLSTSVLSHFLCTTFLHQHAIRFALILDAFAAKPPFPLLLGTRFGQGGSDTWRRVQTKHFPTPYPHDTFSFPFLQNEQLISSTRGDLELQCSIVSTTA